MNKLQSDMITHLYGESVVRREIKDAYDLAAKAIGAQIECTNAKNAILACSRNDIPIKYLKQGLLRQFLSILETAYDKIAENERIVVAKVCKWLTERLQFEEVYISYAKSDEHNPHIDNPKKRLNKLLELSGIKCHIYENTDEKSISDFEKRIADGKIIVIILSNKYFQSEHCMNEWTLVHNSDTRRKKIIYIKYDEEVINIDGEILNNGFDFSNQSYRTFIRQHWEKKETEYNSINRNENDPTEVQIQSFNHNFYKGAFHDINKKLRNTPYYKSSDVPEYDILEEIKQFAPL
jgi:hypothetical protein